MDGESRERSMRYLLLVYDQEDRFEKLGRPALNAELSEYRDFGAEFSQEIRDGDALQPTTTATTVRVRHGKRVITDGPFADVDEQLGGYYVVEAADLDEAINIAAKIPGARFGSVEVRPIRKLS